VSFTFHFFFVRAVVARPTEALPTPFIILNNRALYVCETSFGTAFDAVVNIRV